MKLGDIIFNSIKACNYVPFEISKEKLLYEDGYRDDPDLGIIVNNKWQAFFEAYGLALSLHKVAPITKELEKDEDGNYLIPSDNEEIISIFYIDKYSKEIVEVRYNLVGDYIALDSPNLNNLYISYIRRLEFMDDANFKQYEDDIDIKKEYGISDGLASILVSLISSILFRAYNENDAQVRYNNAVALLNNLRVYGDYKLNKQRRIYPYHG